MGGELVVDFLEHVDSWKLVTEEGVRIRLFEAGGRLELAIVIGDETTIDAMRRSWWEILQAREELQNWQGRLPTAQRQLSQDLARLRATDQLSYAELAQRINQRLTDLLLQIHACLSQLDGRTIVARIRAGVLFAEADNLLEFCRPRWKEARRAQELADALQRIGDGERVWPKNKEPITGDVVNDRLDYWNGEPEGKTG